MLHKEWGAGLLGAMRPQLVLELPGRLQLNLGRMTDNTSVQLALLQITPSFWAMLEFHVRRSILSLSLGNCEPSTVHLNATSAREPEL